MITMSIIVIIIFFIEEPGCERNEENWEVVRGSRIVK